MVFSRMIHLILISLNLASFAAVVVAWCFFAIIEKRKWFDLPWKAGPLWIVTGMGLWDISYQLPGILRFEGNAEDIRHGCQDASWEGRGGPAWQCIALAVVCKNVQSQVVLGTWQPVAFPLRGWGVSLLCCVLALNLGDSPPLTFTTLNLVGSWRWTCGQSGQKGWPNKCSPIPGSSYWTWLIPAQIVIWQLQRAN